MGSVIYDFLSESALFDEAGISDHFAALTDKELRGELAKYREFCLNRLDDLRGEIPSGHQNTVMFSGRDLPSLSQLLRTGLYVECHILDDPLFATTHEPPEMHRRMVRLLGVDNAKLDREQICTALRFLKELTPMVAADYVKFLPISRIYEPPENVAVHYSENQFSDVLPEDLLDFFHDRVQVRSLARMDRQWVVRSALEPSRGIAINFDDHLPTKPWLYHLHDCEIARFDESTGIADVKIRLPDEPPDAARFEAWVHQSINQSARQAHDQLLAEFATGAACGAMYLTRSQFAFDLLQRLGAQSAGSAGHTANALLNLDLPLLSAVDVHTLMRVRAQDGEAFQNFRNALERGLAEVRTEDDPDKARIKLENLTRDLTELKVQEIDPQVASLRRSGALEAAVALIAMAVAISTGGVAATASLLAMTMATLQGFKTYNDYKRQVRANPAFFLWKLKR